MGGQGNLRAGSRKPKILVAKPGLDGHDVGAKVVCRALRDAGFEVIYTGLRQSPEAIATAALQEDVDAIGLSILSGAHLPLCAGVVEAMAEAGLDAGVRWFVGGNIPEADFSALRAMGACAVFPTGSDFDEIAATIRREIEELRP